MTRNGFSLVEMVMVVAILAIVSGMAVVAYGGASAKADEQVAQSECAAIRSACLRFKVDAGRVPASLGELWTKPVDLTGYDPAVRCGWRGPYLSREVQDRYRLDFDEHGLPVITSAVQP